MHILLIHQYFLDQQEGGGSRFNEMTRIWAKAGHQVTVIAGMVHYNTGKKAKKYKGKFIITEHYDQNIVVIRCHVSEQYNVNFLGRVWGYLSFVLSGLIAGIFYARSHYDVLVATSPPLFIGIPAYVLSRFKRIPLIFEVRDLWPESAIDTGVLKNHLIIKLAYSFEGFMYGKSTLINVLTPAFREKLMRDKKVSKEKIIYIPNAADFTWTDRLMEQVSRDELRRKLGLEEGFYIIYVGAHGVANGLGQILDSAKIIKDPRIRFLLIGSGMEKKQLMERKEKEKIHNVLFRDPVPKKEIFEYILASDIGTSVLKKADTFKTIYSNKTFDYMSCKKPVLMAIDGISRQLVETAQCGVYVEPENASDFKAKIDHYLHNPALIREHGENGYAYAKHYFDRKKLALEYLSEMHKIMKQ